MLQLKTKEFFTLIDLKFYTLYGVLIYSFINCFIPFNRFLDFLLSQIWLLYDKFLYSKSIMSNCCLLPRFEFTQSTPPERKKQLIIRSFVIGLRNYIYLYIRIVLNKNKSRKAIHIKHVLRLMYLKNTTVNDKHIGTSVRAQANIKNNKSH